MAVTQVTDRAVSRVYLVLPDGSKVAQIVSAQVQALDGPTSM